MLRDVLIPVLACAVPLTAISLSTGLGWEVGAYYGCALGCAVFASQESARRRATQ